MKGRNVLVTGGGGFLGGAIVKRLVARGDTVTSFSRRIYPNLSRMGVGQIRGDLTDPEATAAACRGMDTVFHAAAKTGIWGDFREYHAVNTIGTQNILAGCISGQVPYLVYTSSPSVVFNGTDMEGVDESVPYPARYRAHYPKTKALAEQAVVRAAGEGLKTIVLRPHLIWGPEDTSLVPRIISRSTKLVRVGDGRNRVDTVYIDNAADAHLLAADKLRENPGLAGRIYFISNGEPVPLWEMIDRILGAAGLPRVGRSMSLGTARVLGAILEGVYTALGAEKEPRMTRFLAEELATAHWFDISAARRDLGYTPRISTAEGLARLKTWLNPDPRTPGGGYAGDPHDRHPRYEGNFRIISRRH